MPGGMGKRGLRTPLFHSHSEFRGVALKRLGIAMLISASSLVISALPANACINCFARPTIGNGGIPYGQYRTDRRGYPEVCFQYVSRSDQCFPLAAWTFTPWGWLR